MQGAWELSHGGRLSFALGGLGGASDLWGDTTVEELSAQIGRTSSTPQKKEWAAHEVMSSRSVEVCKHSLIRPLG